MRTTLRSLFLVFLVAQPVLAADRAGTEFFEKKVRPVLVEHCYSCHSTGAKKQRGGLKLDTRTALLRGGDRGPGLVSGKPEQSLLIQVVRHEAGVPKMPPTGKLSESAIKALVEWVRMGAPDPRMDSPSGSIVTWKEALAARRTWWSLQPVGNPPVPPTRDTTWPLDTVDRFLLSRLERAGLAPTGPADRRTLIRRLSLVTTGLPPTPAEVEAFVADPAPDAYERQVARLLGSTGFGERWARHWLDVVRFSETHGNEWNYEVHHAWRYRDYLIRAFNLDLPYDQFVREHVAGDLLPRPRLEARGRFNESVIGTAFYRFGEVNHDDCISLPQIGYDLWDNQIDTLGKAFQGTTIACARCHDHKLDAISMRDYYALLGTLRSSRQVAHTIDDPEVNARSLRRMQALSDEIRKELASVWLREAREIGDYLLAAQRRAGKSPMKDPRPLEEARLARWTAALTSTSHDLDPLGPWRLAVGATDLSGVWRRLAQEQEKRVRPANGYLSFADFRTGKASGWQVGGQGLREPSPSGTLALNHQGDQVVRAVLPSGFFTHALSDRLNGTLRSPLVPPGKKFISFEVVGKRGSAVRLVSNGCQLNYKNYRALVHDEPRWVTFDLPANGNELRLYAELMTLLDNPKFPDQLSALGGDPGNYRLPWEQALGDGRSYFGITRVVLHDDPKPPEPQPTHLTRLFFGPAPTSMSDLATRYARIVDGVVRAWAAGRAGDDDVRWLDGLVRRGLLGNATTLTPRLVSLVREYRALEQGLQPPRVVPGLADHGPGLAQPIFTRGDCGRPGERVARRYLEVLGGTETPFTSGGSGRLELAERLVRADNPLTARVMVNRIWQHLFGNGLVRTVDDFGRAGELPSHPELLDHLARRFVEDGWSIKQLIRTLVLTRAFRMGAVPPPRAREVDPENRLLHHYPPRRLEAEGIRDSILAASGRLERTLFGPSVQPYRETTNADRRLFPGPLDGNGRRSVYVKNNLMEAPSFLGAFDFPGGKVAQGRRHSTNVPAQALALLNDPFVLGEADRWAGSLVARKGETLSGRIEHLLGVALGRPPSAIERRRFERAAHRLAEVHGVPPDEMLDNRVIWKDLAHATFNLQEFLYIP